MIRNAPLRISHACCVYPPLCRFDDEVRSREAFRRGRELRPPRDDSMFQYRERRECERCSTEIPSRVNADYGDSLPRSARLYARLRCDI